MAQPSLRDVHVDAVLSNISVAYKNDNYLADQVFPRVPVNKKSDLFFTFPKQQWQRNDVELRAPGARARLADYAITTASYVAKTYALAHLIPDEVRLNSDAPLQPDVNATEFVTDALLRAQEIRVAALTTGGSGTWVYSASPTTQWSSDTAAPWSDINTALNGVVSVIGRMPNTMVMSWDVWRYLRQHPDFLERIKYTRPSGTVEPSDLTTWFGINKVLVGTQLYDPAREGATGSPSYIWGDGVWIGYVPAAPALMTPAAGYVFEWQTRQVNRFRLDPEHSDMIEATHSVAEVVSASDAAAIIFNVI